MAEFDINLYDQQGREHAAWLDVVEELKQRGVGDINAGGVDESLHDAIVKWGEELAELRFLDPVDLHRTTALNEKREKYAGKIYSERIPGEEVNTDDENGELDTSSEPQE